MRNPCLIFCSFICIAIVGCSDDPSSNNNNNNNDTNPTVAEYAGENGMNANAFYDGSIAVESLIEFESTESLDATYTEQSATNLDHTGIELALQSTMGVLPGSGSNLRDLNAEISLRVPGKTVGTFAWSTTDKNSRFQIEFDDGAGNTVEYLMVEGSTTLTRNDPGSADPFRAVTGSFSGVLQSPDGKKIAVKGKFKG